MPGKYSPGETRRKSWRNRRSKRLPKEIDHLVRLPVCVLIFGESRLHCDCDGRAKRVGCTEIATDGLNCCVLGVGNPNHGRLHG